MCWAPTASNRPNEDSGEQERKDMGNVAVVGAQWGDEGKGKVVDWLS